jgi:beta-phosphoglucomutase-like phosphatase (HAD superfamily)
MKLVIIAFDCDGTLITTESADKGEITANERVRSLLIALAHCKNVEICVWSGSGAMWANQVVMSLGLKKYVTYIKSKQDELPFTVDIAFDDVQACEMGIMNIIVREK